MVWYFDSTDQIFNFLYQVKVIVINAYHIRGLHLEDIKRIIVDQHSTCMDLQNITSYDNPQDAEDAVLKRIQKDLLYGYCKKLIRPDYVKVNKKPLSKDDLNPNAYWILTMSGKSEEITKLSCDALRYRDLHNRIISASNIKQDTLIIAADVRENYKNRYTR